MEKDFVLNDDFSDISSKSLRLVANAKSMSKWFSIDLTIKLFGIEIISWHYPPEDERLSIRKEKK